MACGECIMSNMNLLPINQVASKFIELSEALATNWSITIKIKRWGTTPRHPIISEPGVTTVIRTLSRLYGFWTTLGKNQEKKGANPLIC